MRSKSEVSIEKSRAWLLSFTQLLFSSALSSSEGGRLKLISSRGKHVYVAGSRWEPVHLHGLNRFTLDCKGPPTGRLQYRLSASLRACDHSDLRAG